MPSLATHRQQLGRVANLHSTRAVSQHALPPRPAGLQGRKGMVWQCPDCTLLNDQAPACCDLCGHPAPAALQTPGTGAARQQQQAGGAAVEVVNLVSEDKEAEQGGSMGSGGSKAAAGGQAEAGAGLSKGAGAAAGVAGWEDDWDEDFQIQLSESRSQPSSHRQWQQLGGSGGAAASPPHAAQPAAEQRVQGGAAGQAAGRPAPKAQRPLGLGKKQAATAGEERRRKERGMAQLHHTADEQGSGSSAETAVTAQVLPGGKQEPARQQVQQQRSAREEPAASITSGSPAPMPSRDAAGGRGSVQPPPQRPQLGKRPLEGSSEHVPVEGLGRQ